MMEHTSPRLGLGSDLSDLLAADLKLVNFLQVSGFTLLTAAS